MYSYYRVLRRIVCSGPELRKLVVCCRYCGIYFITAISNSGRKDLGCPFGCREAHRKERSDSRSKAYYGTPEGKAKKREHNARRSAPSEDGVVDQPLGDRRNESYYSVLVFYLQYIIKVLEKREVRREWIAGLIKKVRQQGIALGNGKGYIDNRLLWQPP